MILSIDGFPKIFQDLSCFASNARKCSYAKCLAKTANSLAVMASTAYLIFFSSVFTYYSYLSPVGNKTHLKRGLIFMVHSVVC